MTADILADAAPQEQKRREALLILGAHERGTELERRAEELEEQLRVLEESEGVEAVPAKAAGDEVGASEPVGTDDLPVLGIPDEEMLVMLIEGIEIGAAPTPLTDRAEGQLPRRR